MMKAVISLLAMINSLATDSRGNATRTLPMVWFCLAGIMYKFVFDDLSAVDFGIAMTPVLTLWGHREYVEKRKQ